MKICAMTEKGDHAENEDRILINDNILFDGTFESECNGQLKICIADGVGGNNAGAVASELVCECLKNIVPKSKSDLLDINTQLLAKSIENKDYSGMATTLSGIFTNNNIIGCFHVGNTRICVCQGRYIKQVTEDHTRVNWLLKTGKISKKAAETYDRRNEITACFGGGNHMYVNALVFQENNATLSNANKIILTSDGVHEYVSIDEMENILSNEKLKPLDACKEIINIAKEKGSNDDKSIVIIEQLGK